MSCVFVEVDGIRGLPVGLFICSILFELVRLLWIIGVRFGVRFFDFFGVFVRGKRGKGVRCRSCCDRSGVFFFRVGLPC